MPLILILTACGGGGGGKSGPTSSKAEEPVRSSTPNVQSDETIERLFTVTRERKVELREDLSNVKEFAHYINDYVVTFRATSGNYRDSKVICRKTYYDQTLKEPTGKFDQDGYKAVVEINLSEKDPANVSYECEVSDRVSTLGKSRVDFKKSFAVEGTKNFTSFIGVDSIETLVILEDGRLVTGGVDVNAKIDRLISMNGKLVTHPENTQTPDNQVGNSGGTITLDVIKAVGQLNVELRGLNGGKQTMEPKKITKVPAKDPKHNGTCRNGRDAGNDSRCEGKKGHRGYPGLAGYPGLSGGNTGSMNFTLAHVGEFKISVKYFPGTGSAGGKGGEGGEGGPGGDGNKITWREPPERDHPCGPQCKSFALNESRTYKNGPKGDKGPDGDDGEKGISGKNEESIVNIDADLFEKILTDWQNF